MINCKDLPSAQAVAGVIQCVKQPDGTWDAYVEGDTLPGPTPQEQQATIESSIVAQCQANLDAFAQSRGYDGILSACTYATSSITKFQTEGQRCVALRDQTWNTLYSILAQVQAGNWPTTGANQKPSGYADIAASLPALTW